MTTVHLTRHKKGKVSIFELNHKNTEIIVLCRNFVFFTMNGLSLSELCRLFCCPPCPGRIASKLAFLPPEPTCELKADENSSTKFSLVLHERADWQFSEREKEYFEAFYTRSSRGNKIACLFVRCSANARCTILFSHGNAVDLGQMTSFFFFFLLV